MASADAVIPTGTTGKGTVPFVHLDIEQTSPHGAPDPIFVINGLPALAGDLTRVYITEKLAGDLFEALKRAKLLIERKPLIGVENTHTTVQVSLKGGAEMVERLTMLTLSLVNIWATMLNPDAFMWPKDSEG